MVLIYTERKKYDPVTIGKLTHFFYGYIGEYEKRITSIFTDKGFSVTINGHAFELIPGVEVTLHPRTGKDIHFTTKSIEYLDGSLLSFNDDKDGYEVRVMNKIKNKQDYDEYKKSLKE